MIDTSARISRENAVGLPDDKMVNEQNLCRALLTVCFILVRLGVGSGEKCGGRFYYAISLFPIHLSLI